MKKNILIALSTVITIVCIIVSIIIIHKPLKENDPIIKEIKLTKALEEYKDYSISLIHNNNGKILGTIESEKTDLILFSTIAIFEYDINTEKINIYEQAGNERIIDFYITGNYLYSCILTYNDETSYKWKIIKKNLTNNKKEEMIVGIIPDAFEYPRILGNNGNSIFVISKNDDHIELLKINENVETLKTITGNHLDMIQLNFAYYKDSNIYYIKSLNENDQILRLNVDTLEEDKIYETNNNLYSINVFEQISVIHEADNNSKVYLTTISNDGKDFINKLEITELLTFSKNITSTSFICHLSEKSWKEYNIQNNNLTSLDFSKLEQYNLLPQYFVIGNDRIIVQSFENTFYIINISKLRR